MYPNHQQQFSNIPTQRPSSVYQPSSTSVKHEHFHYYYQTKDNHLNKHPNFNGFNGIGSSEFLTKEATPSYAIQSKPLYIQNDPKLPYKVQYKGDPYKRKLDDQEELLPIPSNLSYFPIQARSDDELVNDDETEESNKDDVTTTDKNTRKML